MTIFFTKKAKIQVLMFISVATISYSCLVPEKSKTASADSLNIVNEGPIIDSALAKQLGADDYGMKQYVMVLLRRGRKRWMIDSATANRLQKAHMENIKRLSDEGKLVVAGPFSDDTDLKGIYVFNVKTVAEAQQLCSTDPAIQAQSLTMEFHPWYGSAALQKTTEIHNKIAKKGF